METSALLRFLHWGETGKPLTLQYYWNNSADSRAKPEIVYFTAGWTEKLQCKTVKAVFKHKYLQYLVNIFWKTVQERQMFGLWHSRFVPAVDLFYFIFDFESLSQTQPAPQCA